MTRAAEPSSTPIACTLGAGDYAERLAWIGALNRDALRASRRDGRALELTYAPDAEPRVRELVRREEDCCAFLRFTIDVAPEALRLHIEAPPEAHDAADVLFEPFLGRAAEPDPGEVEPRTTAACDGDCGCAPPATPMSDAAGASPSNLGPRVPGVAATSTAVAALACGVCCALPFALPAAALSAFGGVIAVAARAYWWALGVAAIAVAAAWTWVAWQSARAGRRPARSTVVAMGAATVVLLAALSWSFVEARVITWLRA